MNPNLGLAQQGLKKLVNGDTQRLSSAIVGRKIAESSTEELKQTIRYILVKLGVRERNWPEDDEKIILLRHFVENYAWHTLNEIVLAFDMAIVGKLDGDFACYENFTCEYVSRVMRAYRRWAAEEYKQIPAPPSPERPKEKISDFAMLRWLAQEIQFIKTGKPVEFVPLELYDYLDMRGKINISKEEKQLYLEKAVQWRANDLAKEVEKNNSLDNRTVLKQFSFMRKRGYFTGPEVERLKGIAKKLLFFDLVQKRS